MTLVEFLLARISEDESAAREVHRADNWHIDSDWRDDRAGLVGGGKTLATFALDEDAAAPEHIARHHPERVLSDCAAKRHIIQMHSSPHYCSGNHRDPRTALCDPCATTQWLALSHADHPDYREEWKP